VHYTAIKSFEPDLFKILLVLCILLAVILVVLVLFATYCFCVSKKISRRSKKVSSLERDLEKKNNKTKTDKVDLSASLVFKQQLVKGLV
jgi:Tfp pilus assembly protein PilO